MTRLKAEALWPIMKAFAKGADVQIQDPETDDWVDVPNPTFAPEVRWRIKPELPDFEDWWASNFNGWPHAEKETAKKAWVESASRKQAT